MTPKIREDKDKQRKTLEREISRKDWFSTIIKDIEERKIIYSDPRIKGYMREAHEFVIKEYISNYLNKDEDLKESALNHWNKIKQEGERERIKGVENNLKNLERTLGKSVVSTETKEILIIHAEEEIKTQVPEEITKVYLDMLYKMKEKYISQNE